MSNPRGVFWRAAPEGSQIQKLPAGQERGDWWIRYFCQNGHKHREKVGPKGIAADQYAKRKLQVRTENYCPTLQVAPPTVQELTDKVVQDYLLNARSTVQRARELQRHLVAGLGPKARGETLTRGHLEAYAAKRRQAGAAPATINREFAMLRRGYSLCREAIPVPPAFPMLQEKNVRTGFFEEADFRKLQGELPVPVQPVAEFMYLTGWRIGEVLPLTWKNVDFKAGVIRLEPGTTKNDEGRTFPFQVLPPLESLMKRLHADRSDMHLKVFHRNGRPIKDFRTAWRLACERVGLGGRVPHDFRRTAVRNLERAGVPRSVAMKLTGHKTESVYRRYAIVSEADLTEGVRKLAELHKRQEMET